MTTQEIFDLCIQTGIDNDPRGRDKVEKVLSRTKREYEELPPDKKDEFDLDKITNPYADTGFHFGDPNRSVKRVLACIDPFPAEVLLAKELERMGKPIDLIIGHHPIGKALATLHEVMMDIQTEVLSQKGVPENISEKIMEERLDQVSRSVSPENHYEGIDMAKILNIPIMNIHAPADNSVWKYIEDYLAKEKPETLKEILEKLKEIPEYKAASKLGSGPIIFSGSEKSKTGKIIVGMTGGTSGSEKIYERMSHYGIGTVVDMHMSEKSREEAAKHYINVLVAGHMSSDSLGMNLILDKLEKAGIEIIPCSGLIRYSRNK